MKSDNAVKSKENKTTGKSNAGNSTKKNKTGVTFSDATANATEKVKAKSGRGLANEGTIVSYDEQR